PKVGWKVPLLSLHEPFPHAFGALHFPKQSLAVSGFNERLESFQTGHVLIELGDEIVAIPEANVPPHLRRRGRNPGGIPIASTAEGLKIQIRRLGLLDRRNRVHQRISHDVRQVTDGAQNPIVQIRIHLRYLRARVLRQSSYFSKRVRRRAGRRRQYAAAAAELTHRSRLDAAFFLPGDRMATDDSHVLRDERLHPRNETPFYAA